MLYQFSYQQFPVLTHQGIQIRFSKRWKKWKKSFFSLYRSVRNHKWCTKKKMLHLVGTETQKIFETLQDTGNTYDEVITKLMSRKIYHMDEVYSERRNKKQMNHEINLLLDYVNWQHIVNMKIMLTMKLEIKW